MDLCYNTAARFTKWAVKSGLPREPMVVVDVGVQGGEHSRWQVFGDRLSIHGFDAIQEVVEGLKAKNRTDSNRHYHWIAAGEEDGETELSFNAADPYSSSLFRQTPDRYVSAGQRRDELRRVPLRRLDTLLETGIIPQPDFLKVDVEGYEKRVLAGAKKVLASGLLAFEAETNMNTSPEYLRTHFGALLDVATDNGLRVLDLAFNRVPTTTFQSALEKEGMGRVKSARAVGKVSTMNVLFCRDFVAEKESPSSYVKLPLPVGPDQVVKMMMLLESYGLNDLAIDLAQRFRQELAKVLDVDNAMRLLADPHCRLHAWDYPFRERLKSWPQRAAKRLLRK